MTELKTKLAPLQFSAIKVKPEYMEKWNERSTDFILLSRNGEPIRNTLYRIGGLNTPRLNTAPYFMLLKHVEAFYDDTITKDPKRKPHLESRWVILDREGNEKVEFKQFASPYWVENSVLYSLDQNYYNIETGYHYGKSYHTLTSDDFVFIENHYDKDVSRRGVLKINKKDGTFELFPIKR